MSYIPGLELALNCEPGFGDVLVKTFICFHDCGLDRLISCVKRGQQAFNLVDVVGNIGF